MPFPRIAVAAALVGVAAPCVSSAAQRAEVPHETAASQNEPPPVAREFRGAWVATVGNIDWPSRPDLSTWEAQQELLAILNRAVALRLNAIILQVRPGTDALYDSRRGARRGVAPPP